MPQGRVTLTDVAAHAGVSKATVSMVLNDHPAVAEKTRARVRVSLGELGYVYNRAAASLRKGSTHAIGLMVTTLMNPYFAEFAESIQAELDAQGMDVLLGVTGDDPARQQRLLLSMAGRRVDGIVMVPAQGTVAADVTPFQTPLLMLTRRVIGLEVDYVGGDNVKGSYSATKHLIADHGSARIAFLGGSEQSSSRAERLSGFHRAIAEHGLVTPASWESTCPSDRRMARAAALPLLADNDLDAVVCYNDATAFGVMDAAVELDLAIGRDIRITGFDDLEDAAFATPTLTSVSVKATNAGHAAVQMLLARIRGEGGEVEERILPANLVRRESCGC